LTVNVSWEVRTMKTINVRDCSVTYKGWEQRFRFKVGFWGRLKFLFHGYNAEFVINADMSGGSENWR